MVSYPTGPWIRGTSLKLTGETDETAGDSKMVDEEGGLGDEKAVMDHVGRHGVANLD